jgi:3-phenylpropionate/trans-cinnamate dioxygenase ferredoxin reductase subunit
LTGLATLHCAAAARYWDRETDGALVCLAMRDETRDMRTFTFAGSEGQYFDFRPGQYFTFDVPIDDGLVDGAMAQRCYSISSSSLRPRTVSITVKRVAGGRMSNWLHDHLKPGDVIRAMGPLGLFTPPPVLPDKLLLLSGGSGITPMMAIVRAFADAACCPDTVFLHAARTPADFAFADDLRLLAKALPRFRLILLPEIGDDSFTEVLGRISPAFMDMAVPDLAQRLVMCCGPAPFMAAARAICRDRGVPDERYVEESFDAASLPLPDPAPAATAFSVRFSRQGKAIAVGTGQSILSAARTQGVMLPSSCANGLCGTCKTKLVSGTVDMQHNGGIRQREIDAGMILPCCATPLSDLVLER